LDLLNEKVKDNEVRKMKRTWTDPLVRRMDDGEIGMIGIGHCTCTCKCNVVVV
jgi:hypothetical protein